MSMNGVASELPPSPPLATALTVQVQMDGGKRTIIAQTYIDRDAEASAYNAVLDRLSRAIDRQEDYYVLQQLRRHIEAVEADLRTKEVDQSSYESTLRAAWVSRGKRGEFTLSDQEAQAVHQKGVTVEQTRVGLARVTKERDELLSRLNGGG